MKATTISATPEGTPEQQVRDKWANNLAQWVGPQTAEFPYRKLTRKGLAHQLTEAGIPVSEKAVGGWLRGEYAPRPHVQAAIARILELPVAAIFPVDGVAA